jgi:hypothetical protein
MTNEDLEERGIDQNKSIEIEKLARTFLAEQGEIDRMSRINDVCESEAQYNACFAERYLRCESHRIVLAYKVHYRLNNIARVVAKQATGYDFVIRAKNLLWALLIQAIFNQDNVEELAATYGKTLVMETDYSEVLKNLATTKVRLILKSAVADDPYKQNLKEEKYSFLRTKAMYQRCMSIANDRYGWKRRSI